MDRAIADYPFFNPLVGAYRWRGRVLAGWWAGSGLCASRQCSAKAEGGYCVAGVAVICALFPVALADRGD